METLLADFQVTNQPRLVSHALVMMDDPANPTAEETTRFEEAKAAYANGMSFEDVVVNYSDDTSNNMIKGSLGYMDVTTQYEENFLNAALALTEAGQVSDWIQTSYGWHLIRVDAMDLESLKEYQEFYTAILSTDPSLQANVIWSKAKELNVDFLGNDELKAEILNYMGIEE